MEIKIKMDKTAIIVSAIVGSLGLLSAILGFAAEGSPSAALGICAFVFLLMGQIIVSAVGGCCGSCKSREIPSETKRVVGIVCAVTSWIATVAACVMFEQNAGLNLRGYYMAGIYAGGGVLALAATALAIASFILMRAQPADGAAPKTPGEQPAPPGIAMGQPQFPPAAAAGAQNMQPPPQGRAQV
ncbi:hypothetical protein GQ55_3G258000 [Panicum hallii var. hallii]|uniref:Uncharacterized protein n=1 Tax=Panicum hallii var. hallii TaxID=1504633 RepID=A0A2T7EDD5_9POAL|nr:hypothetical protein GQ55_3G258000 [Panicum hallii var. hallii]